MTVPFAMYACSGNEGPVGPQGPTGPQGASGEQGPIGPQGNDGVSVSNVYLQDNTLYVTLSDGQIIDAGMITFNAGCTDPIACNYDEGANFNNGMCSYIGSSCNDGNNNTFNDALNADCVCEGIIQTTGCTAQ
jgi:hypothetical protein